MGEMTNECVILGFKSVIGHSFIGHLVICLNLIWTFIH